MLLGGYRGDYVTHDQCWIISLLNLLVISHFYCSFCHHFRSLLRCLWNTTRV